jgi:hypothetical protein
VPYSILARRANCFICSPAENRTQLPRLKAECIANNASKEYSVTLVLRSIEGLRFLYLYVYLYVLYIIHNFYFLLVRHTGIEPVQLMHQFYRLAQLSYVGGTPIYASLCIRHTPFVFCSLCGLSRLLRLFSERELNHNQPRS